MSTVMHGRRRGSSRDSPQDAVDMNEYNNDMNMRTTGDLRNVTILTREDWDRIQLQLNQRQIDQEQIKQAKEAKEKLHQLSKNQIKNWNNTIAGQRIMKLEARKIREAKEEEERKAIDVEEAKYQAMSRKEAIEKAKTLQYYQTDRVKNFHGSLLLTEVLKEREAQVELNKLKRMNDCKKDKRWLEHEQQQNDKDDELEQGRAGDRFSKSRLTAQFQQVQMGENKNKQAKEIASDKIEGQHLTKLAEQYNNERKQLEQIRQEEAQCLLHENIKQINDVKTMRGLLQEQDEDFDEECRIFASAKRKMMKLRGEKENFLRTEKQSRLDKIREKLNAQMQQKMDDEDDRIKRAVEETDAKLTQTEVEKMGLVKQTLKEMDDFRIIQFKAAEKTKEEDMRIAKETLAANKVAAQEFANNETSKKSRRYQNLKTLQTFHVKQIDESKMLLEDLRERQLLQDAKNIELIGLEECQFQDYTSKVIEHSRKGGRNVYPLLKAAIPGVGGGRGPLLEGKGGIRPSYMVADKSGVEMSSHQRASTNLIKESIYGNGETHKRLGFTW